VEGEIKTPPFSQKARLEAGYLLRRLQQSETLGMPHSRPLPSIGPRCLNCESTDERSAWRIVYRIDSDAIIILDVFSKKRRTTPKVIVDLCKRRLREYENA
jgi:phage-related protein